MKDWTKRAVPKEPPTLEIGFITHKSYYFGDENSTDQLNDAQFREPLSPPKVELYGDYLLSLEFDANFDAGLRYYLDVLHMAERHRKDLRGQSHYFWLRPLVFRRGDFALTFPWYDTFREADHFLTALSRSHVGEIYSDMDQGWGLAVIATDDRLYLRQWNPDSGKEHSVISIEKAALQGQVSVVRDRTIRILDKLNDTLGVTHCWAHDEPPN